MDTNIIYKFLPIERLTYLEDELLRITQPGDLNDPYECLPIPPTIDDLISIMNKVTEEKVKEFKGSKKQKEANRKIYVTAFQKEIDGVRKNIPNNFKERFVKNSMDNVNRNVGLISFSRRWDSSLMWAHYTQSHKGFCIGFNAQNVFFNKYRNLEDSPIVFQPVLYSDKRIKVPIEKGEKIDPKVMLTKSTDWEYEHEERLLVSLPLANKRITNEPYDICLFKVPHNLITEIILGANIKDEDSKKIIAFCKSKSIEVYQSRISEERFDMERVKI